MSSLYVTEAGSFIKRPGGHILVGRNNEVLFEVPLERIEDITCLIQYLYLVLLLLILLNAVCL